ncbi:MAG: hypothetical protein J2P47_12345 [Acetobacteraceae bacterium]|nr:hypothetical protein [Acetobacteraceae bacterium]
MRALAFVPLLAAAPLLASCGDLPRPFQGAPGATAMRLAEPPPPRLVVPPPGDALLPDAASHELAADVAAGLQEQEVPAIAEAPRKGDWQLLVTARERGGAIVPLYTVQNPKGEAQGNAEGRPVPLKAWAAAEPATLKSAATTAAPDIAALLTRIEAARQEADPNSLINRPARVRVAEVEGAPGDGNVTLTKQMREKLAKLGPIVQDTAMGADFSVQGHVRMVPEAGGLERVEIQWILTSASGDERGRIVQLNEVPAGSLNGYWGDVAVVVAQEAAGGVKDALMTQTGRRAAQTGRQAAQKRP